MPPDSTESPDYNTLGHSISPTQSGNSSGPVETDLLAQVVAAYKAEDLEDEFRAAKDAYTVLLPLLAREIAPTYMLKKVLKI